MSEFWDKQRTAYLKSLQQIQEDKQAAHIYELEKQVAELQKKVEEKPKRQFLHDRCSLCNAPLYQDVWLSERADGMGMEHKKDDCIRYLADQVMQLSVQLAYK